MQSPAPKMIAAAMSLLAVAGMAGGARCLSATNAQCSVSSLLGGGPTLDVPYAETRTEAVDKMLDMAKVSAGDRVIDLGTGDGRMLLRAAARGAGGLGVDIDPALVRQATASAVRQNVGDRVTFATQDLFDTPLAGADVVTMFLLPEINLRLRPRLLDELAPGARVVSHAFTMGEWAPDRAERVGGSRLYLWVVPARIGGEWLLSGPDAERRLTIDQRFQTFAGHDAGGEALFGGKMDGQNLSFTLRRDGRDERYEGRVVGDRIVGDTPYRWIATRIS